MESGLRSAEREENTAGLVAAAGDLDVGPVARQFAVLTAALVSAGSLAEVLERVVAAGSRIVPAADIASITLRAPDGTFHTPTETEAAATELDRLQYRFDEGPCVEAARPDGPAAAVSTDLATDPRWPRFGPAAAGLGFRSLVATALLPDAVAPRLSGALNVYSRRPGAFSPADRDTLLLLATHASLALATTQAVTRGELQLEQLRQAIDSRDVIGQAKGVLMARRGITADEAFAILRQASQDINVKLRDVAASVAAHVVDVEDLPDLGRG
jgi:GAF domain-containing protein